VLGEVVSANYFDVLGVRSMLGQPFTPEVRRGDWAAEVVLSHGFWQRQFGGDRSIIGRTIRLNTQPFTIVGVSPAGFRGLERGTEIDVRMPILPDGRELAQVALIGANPERALSAVARLKAGSSLAHASVLASQQLGQFLRIAPSRRYSDRGIDRVTLVPVGNGDSGVLGQLHTPLYVLFVMVALVLLVACANVANVLLARAAARGRELAVRMSIGAGRSRLVRQMLAESLLLSLVAGLVAVAIGTWAARGLVHFVPQGHVATDLDLQMDTATVLFAFALSLVACVTFGLAPALRTTRFSLVAMLKADSRASTGDLSGGALRKLLVVSQVACSLVLLIGAGIFVRTMIDLWPTDYGGRPERVVLLTMKPQREIYTPDQRHALMTEIVRRVSGMPGVQAAGVAEYGPLGSRTSERQESVEAQPGRAVRAEVDWVSGGFFQAVGLPRIAGRDLTAADAPGAPRVVVVNRSLAHALFGDANPLGRGIRLTHVADGPTYEVVGVVGDSRYYDVHGAARPTLFFAFQDAAPYMPTLLVRGAHPNIDTLVSAVRRELDALDDGFRSSASRRSKNVSGIPSHANASSPGSQPQSDSWRWRWPGWDSMESWRTRWRAGRERSGSGWRSDPVHARCSGWWRKKRSSWSAWAASSASGCPWPAGEPCLDNCPACQRLTDRYCSPAPRPC
jgi:predicted permease